MSDLIRQQLQGSLQASSLAQLAKERKTERLTFLVLDYSGSMDQPVEYGGSTRRIDALRSLADKLRAEVKCPQVGFSDHAHFIERVPEPEGGTNLKGAIDFCRDQGAKHLIIVSDGAPDDTQGALEAAQRFSGPIDTFYVGPEGGGGADFLKRLAKAAGGQHQSTSLGDQKQLAAAIKGLLTSGKIT